VLLRCLPVHSVKDLSDFLTRERLVPTEGDGFPNDASPGTLYLRAVPGALADRLLEGVRRAGGWGARLRGADGHSAPADGVLLVGGWDALVRLPEALPAGEERDRLCREFGAVCRHVLREAPEPIRSGGKTLDFARGPLVMAVLNVTPDSFYDGGRYLDPARAEEQARRLIEQGADVLDVGGASTRPGSDPVPEDVEAARVVPVIRAVRRSWDGWVSVDTASSRVARMALDEGADLINDVSAGRMDPGMKRVAAESGAPAILMHMQGTPKDMQVRPRYDSLLGEIIEALRGWIREWEDAGCRRERLLVDPGIGFGKTLAHNLALLRNLREMKVLGRPVVLGTSRKSFIGAVLQRQVQDRLPGTLATLAVGAMNGADIFRVHDVAEAREALALVDAIQKA